MPTPIGHLTVFCGPREAMARQARRGKGEVADLERWLRGWCPTTEPAHALLHGRIWAELGSHFCYTPSANAKKLDSVAAPDGKEDTRSITPTPWWSVNHGEARNRPTKVKPRCHRPATERGL